MKTNIHFLSYIAQLFLQCKMFQAKVVQKITKRIVYSVTVFRKSCHLWDNVVKYCTAGQTTDDNMAHANCKLDNWDYEHTQRLCNTHCFSTSTMVVRTHLIVTLYVPFLSCSEMCACTYSNVVLNQ